MSGQDRQETITVLNLMLRRLRSDEDDFKYEQYSCFVLAFPGITGRPWQEPKKPGKTSAAAHRKRGRGRKVSFILEAAARILREEGSAGFNTNRIAERAGNALSEQHGYSRQGSILVALARNILVDDMEALRSALDGPARRGP
ncbi:MAG: hypothetical protein M9905_17040 [Rhizobiaceae bacterium]|nr:hypothetical protein [Rhizobiaceae bacterium]